MSGLYSVKLKDCYTMMNGGIIPIFSGGTEEIHKDP
jgi:hypothetical protein